MLKAKVTSRHLWRGAVVATAVASAAVAGLLLIAWARSPRWLSAVTLDAAAWHGTATSANHVINLSFATSPRRSGSPGDWTNVPERGFGFREVNMPAAGLQVFEALGPAWWNRLGFRADCFRAAGVNSINVPGALCVELYVPHWAPLLLLCGAWGAWAGRTARRTRRTKRGACVQCGYDLRATPERCPECGAAPVPPRELPHNPPMQRTATAGSGAVE